MRENNLSCYNKTKIMKDSNMPHINLSILGSQRCGKSALTVRYLTKRFIGEYDSEQDTFVNRSVSIGGKTTDLHVTDTAKCDWLRAPQSLIGWSNAIIIVFSTTDVSSFEFAKYVLQTLNITKRVDSSCVMLLANKLDLKHLRRVPYDKAKSLADRYGILYGETSAASDLVGVQNAFNTLLEQTLYSQLTKMQTLKISFETLEEFENACRTLRIRRRSSDSLRQSSLSSSDEDDQKFSSDSNNNSFPFPLHQKKKTIQIASFIEKVGKTNARKDSHVHHH